ncbi:signal peptidase II (plasmid) [Jannaschia sp. M317]|nr:signal peptidase II [Jannaschia sp. M317]
MRPPVQFGVAMAVVALVMDQATKAAVVANASQLEGGLTVFPGFDLVFARNTGVAFGLLGTLPPWGLALLAIGIVAFLVVGMARTHSLVEGIAYGTVIGGALGNIIDRIRLGGVTDFLDFYVGVAHWPAFNMADVFVVCGAACLVMLGGRKPALDGG